ncbi:MAG TPA: flagellar hook-basal body complex protein [Desulfosporosinus sp.]|nr:flagellar hook-basal body complex protein [Desulfosporosinus sp.]
MRLIGTAASGVRAQQVAMDTLGNNLANVNTPGFKASQMDFAEALSTEVRSGNTKTGGNNTGATTLGVGAGVVYNAIGTDFQQGTLTPTDRPLDLGIDGSGFFQVKTPDGSTAYTRVGAFQVDGSGQLADMQGNVVQPSIAVPSGATELSVASNGEITGVVAGTKTTFGQISLAGFQNPEGLQKNGDNLFVPTVNSGAPQVGQPGTTIGNQVIGTIRGQSLEQSNVDLATSMTDLVQVQRAYQVNARLVSDGDQMWGIANTMRR